MIKSNENHNQLARCADCYRFRVVIIIDGNSNRFRVEAGPINCYAIKRVFDDEKGRPESLNLKTAVEHSKWVVVWKPLMLRQGSPELIEGLSTNGFHTLQLIFLG